MPLRVNRRRWRSLPSMTPQKEVRVFKVGDAVKIVGGNAPIDKIGKLGVIKTVLVNGAIVQLGKNKFTPVQFKNLKFIA